MDAVRFLQDLTIVLSTAAAVLLVFRKLGQPPVLGYLAAGMIIGPHTPPMPLVSDPHTLETLAEVGVVFLLFALGVEFNLSRLAGAGVKAVACALLEALLMIGVGAGAGLFMGWGVVESLVLGGVVAVAGTAIVARTLLQSGSAQWAELVAGVLIAEDVVAVILIAVFSSLGDLGAVSASGLGAVLWRFGVVSTVVLVASLVLVPRMLAMADRAGMEEVKTLVVVSVCFGVALVTQRAGYSAALGAFLAGAVASVGESTTKLNRIAAPFRDVFGAVFFVSVGMLLDPKWLIANWGLALGLTALVVVSRLLVNAAAMAAVGERPAAAVQAALAMLPIGEFSFILAQLAQKHGLTAQPVYPLAVLLCFGTTLVSAQALPWATAGRVDRLIPSPLGRSWERYAAYLGARRVSTTFSQAWALIKPSLLQIALNVLGLTGLFLAAFELRQRQPWLETFPGAVWAGAALVSMPFLNALIRKSQAAVLIAFEACSAPDPKGRAPMEVHPKLARFLAALATALPAAWYLSAGARLLPPMPYALLPLTLVALAAVLLWRRVSRLYALLQAALRDSFKKEQGDAGTAAAALSVFVDSLSPETMSLGSFDLHSRHWAAGKTVAEIGLRARTGATLIQVAHHGKPPHTPGPDHLLAAGDHLILVGEPGQLAAAKAFLEKGA